MCKNNEKNKNLQAERYMRKLTSVSTRFENEAVKITFNILHLLAKLVLYEVLKYNYNSRSKKMTLSKNPGNYCVPDCYERKVFNSFVK